MGKRILLLILALFVSGCLPEGEDWKTDQAMRQDIFFRCLAAIPEGPKRTHYNDWAEVVSECDNAAYYQARYCANCGEPTTSND